MAEHQSNIGLHILAGNSSFTNAADTVHQYGGTAFEQVAPHLGKLISTPYDVTFFGFEKIVQAFWYCAKVIGMKLVLLH